MMANKIQGTICRFGRGLMAAVLLAGAVLSVPFDGSAANAIQLENLKPGSTG
jgi:hypothetical protein